MAKAPQIRPRRGIRALTSAADHLNYEWRMVRASATAVENASSAGDIWATNIALECFLLHARVIRDFFAGRANRNDVLAKDFLTVRPRVQLPLLRSRTTRTRLNRGIAHLSFSRSRLGRDWPVRRLLSEIDGAMTAFSSRLEAEHPRLAQIVSAV